MNLEINGILTFFSMIIVAIIELVPQLNRLEKRQKQLASMLGAVLLALGLHIFTSCIGENLCNLDIGVLVDAVTSWLIQQGSHYGTKYIKR